MKCPKCNTIMISHKGKDTRANTCKVVVSYSFGSVKVREYKCLNCNETIGTEERVVQNYKKISTDIEPVIKEPKPRKIKRYVEENYD